MIRRPPRSTLFPYNDALPISPFGRSAPARRAIGAPVEQRASCAHFSEEPRPRAKAGRSEEHTSELQSRRDLVCRLLLEKKKKKTNNQRITSIHTQLRMSLSYP